MKWFRNLKIGIRITIGFLLVAIIMGVLGIIGIASMKEINESYSFEYNESAELLASIEGISSSFQQIRMNLYGLVMAEAPSEKQYFLERMNEHKNTIDQNVAKYKEMHSDQDKTEEVKRELELLDAVETSLNAYNEKMNEMIERVGIDPESRAEAFELLKEGGELDTLALSVSNAIDELVSYNNDHAKEKIARNKQQAYYAELIMIIAIAIGVLLAIVLGFLISRKISNPINKIVEVAEKLAMGDMNVSIEADSEDEIGRLMNSFGKMIASNREQSLAIEKMADTDLTVDVPIRSEKDILGQKLQKMNDGLNRLFRDINASAEQLAVGAKQLADSSMILSQGATEQASSIEELTAALEEISSQTELNAKNADNANKLTEAAKSNALEVKNQMNDMLQAMEDIKKSSAAISKIIKVIDDIAFQTNILSLNAAVEAARAGQHGKGFAVVAEEVRNLAARSAEAAKETTEMIEDSIKKSETGTKISEKTAEALNKIVKQVERVADLVNDIAKASNEQASAITQINQGIMQVSEVVQTNTATAEENAAASEELSRQAELLKQMVGGVKYKADVKSNNDIINELSPEVLKMLEEMSKKKRLTSGFENGMDDDLKNIAKLSSDAENEAATTKPSIDLGDKEFGKY
ncbi:MAG TPA: HAMP domain-containing protein [Syntrophomonadaceae bacterium]|nr:HAMP domain-containing protein [Syntrophomonadaceae bacterium]